MDFYFKANETAPLLRDHLNMGGANPAGETITVTSRYLERNGSPWIGIMGEYHFCRSPRKYWRKELAKMKAGGITIVSTYLFWIYHEEEEGVFRFDGDNDIRAFVMEAGQAGLDVILRIGPWAHGECRNGGFPEWLLDKNCTLRSMDPAYLGYVRRFYEKIAEQVQGLFFQDGGNIIGIQLENECVNDAEYLKTLKEMAVECGMEAPLYTVTGWGGTGGARIPENDVLPLFGGYCALPWTQNTDPLPPSEHFFFQQVRNDGDIGADLEVLKYHQDGNWRMPYERYPFATCELGGGTQVTWHRRPRISGMDIYALALVKIGSGCNQPGYYMYHGGTNKIGRRTTFQESRESRYINNNDLPMLSYDFQAPLSEYGEIREQYRLLNLLHLFLQDFGEIIAPMGAADAQEKPGRWDKSMLRAGLRTDGKSGFLFVNHHQRLAVLDDVKNVVLHAADVQFPPLDVCGDIAFILPFHQTLGNSSLTYATAQPVCREGDIWFFVKIPGIPAEYVLDGKRYAADVSGKEDVLTKDGVTIVTLSWEQARYLRRLPDGIYLGNGCDLYWMDGKVCCAEGGDYVCGKWTPEKKRFEAFKLSAPDDHPNVWYEKAEKQSVDERYLKELTLGGMDAFAWERIDTDCPHGFIEIDRPHDTAQIYADGIPVADHFDYGAPWRIPAALIYGKESYLVRAGRVKEIYFEKP